jgi:hypothetical protein
VVGMSKLHLPVVVLLAACGDDPVSYSSPVGIELKAKSGEVNNSNALTPEKNITTESGNPYGKFVSDAQATLGRDPGNIVLDQLTMTLGAQSTNVANLEQVMTGDVYVQFLTSDTNNTYVVGHFGSPTGVGPVGGHPDWQLADVGDPDVAKMMGGSFKVVLNAPAAADFATKGAEVSIQLTFTFTAFE